jgi:hypothetical protein
MPQHAGASFGFDCDLNGHDNDVGLSPSSLQFSRVIAMNCVDFLADVQDFAHIQKSAFRSYRACHLFEKYIMHGAIRQVHLASEWFQNTSFIRNFVVYQLLIKL